MIDVASICYVLCIYVLFVLSIRFQWLRLNHQKHEHNESTQREEKKKIIVCMNRRIEQNKRKINVDRIEFGCSLEA